MYSRISFWGEILLFGIKLPISARHWHVLVARFSITRYIWFNNNEASQLLHKRYKLEKNWNSWIKNLIEWNNKVHVVLSRKAISTKELNLLIKELCHEIYHNLGNRHQIGFIASHYLYFYSNQKKRETGPVRESNPGPLAPEARIMPLDQQAILN